MLRQFFIRFHPNSLYYYDMKLQKRLLASLLIASSGLLIAPATAFDTPQPVITLEPGAEAIDFSLEGVDGKTYSLDDFSGSKLLALIFTTNHCPDSRGAWGRIPAIAADYDPADFQLVAINGNNPNSLRPDELGHSVYNDSFEEMKMLAEEEGWKFPYLYDGDTQEVTLAYGAPVTPFVYLFDENRRLQYVGRLDDMRHDPRPTDKSYLRDAIDALLAGEEIAEKQTSGMGCSTKWLWLRDSIERDQKAWESHEVTVDPLDAELAATLRKNNSNNLRLIYIWSTTCGPCIQDFPLYVDTYRRYQNRNFDFITIAIDPPDDSANVLRFLKSEHAALSPRTADSATAEGRSTNNFHFTGEDPEELIKAMNSDWKGPIPFTMLVDPNGEIVWSKGGAEPTDDVAMRRAIVEWFDRRWQD